MLPVNPQRKAVLHDDEYPFPHSTGQSGQREARSPLVDRQTACQPLLRPPSYHLAMGAYTWRLSEAYKIRL